MDYTRTHDKAKDLVMKEVDRLVDKGSLNPQELHSLYEAYETIEHICKAKDAETMESGGYSERRYSMWGPNHDRYYDIHAYNDGNSYRRDSMGRYSRTDAKESMVNGLYAMMGDATNEAERGAIQDCINRLKA
jgi:hypothetical protein